MAEPLNATFFAFRKRERGGVLLSTSLAFAAIMIAAFGLFAWLNWQAFLDYINWVSSLSQVSRDGQPGDAEVLARMMPPSSVMGLAPSYFLFLIFYYLLLAAYEAACLKWMIRGETGGFFGLTLNADTWRVYSTYWLWLVLLLAAYVVIGIAVFTTIGGVALGAGAAGGDANAVAPTAVIAVLLLVVAVIVFLVYFSVRFAPAAATSIAKRRFAFFDAWTVTKGRFWALLGAFVLLFLMYLVGIIVAEIAIGVIMALGMAGQMQGGAEPQTPQEVYALFASPSVLIPAAILGLAMMVGGFLFYIALFGVNARAAQAAVEEGKITPVGP